MDIGRYNIEQLSEGRFKIFEDGDITRVTGEEVDNPYGDALPMNISSVTGINPVYLTDGTHHILLDTGLGWGLDTGSNYQDVSNIQTNLAIFDISPGDITHVVLTHLHYDHSAGSTYVDNRAQTKPTFPNARYYIQQKEWDYALMKAGSDTHIKGIEYRMDELYRLAGDERFIYLDTDCEELLPGITLLRTGGHTPGHQVVRIRGGEQTAYYLGDLVPNDHHLNRYAMQKKDHDPIQAKKKKFQLLKSAFKENACLFLYHSVYSKIGRLDKDQKQNYVLKEVNRES